MSPIVRGELGTRQWLARKGPQIYSLDVFVRVCGWVCGWVWVWVCVFLSWLGKAVIA